MTSRTRPCRAGTTPKTTPVTIVTSIVNAERRAIEPDFVQPRQRVRSVRDDSLHRGVREDQADGAADRGEQHALGQHLADQPRRAGAERRADRQLACADRPAREHQVGDVRARHQQDERDGGEEQLQRRARRSDNPLLQRTDADTHVRIGVRIPLLEILRDAMHLVLRLRQRHARLQPRDDTQIVRPPRARDALRRPSHRHPDVQRRVVEAEVRRQDADDGARRPSSDTVRPTIV